jgi:hypothetical protein
VPNAEAIIFPRIVHAKTPPKIKWSPTNGVKETAAPQANPLAIE